MSVSTRIRFPGSQPWFGHHRVWQKTLYLVKCSFSHYSYFMFYSYAIILMGCYVTPKVTGDPFLYLGCGPVGVGEVGLLQAAVCPACSTCSEAGWELHPRVHEEGTRQLDHGALAEVSGSFIHRVQEVLHTLICRARERENLQLSRWAKGQQRLHQGSAALNSSADTRGLWKLKHYNNWSTLDFMGY